MVLSGVSALCVYANEHDLLELTAQEQSWIKQNSNNLRLFFNTEFPPVEFISSNGAFVGIGADVFALIEKRLGVRFPKEPCEDWNKHLKALETGTCAIAPTIVRTVERERFAYFTDPYAIVPVVIIGTTGSRTGIALEDLKGKKVAVVSGYATEEYLRKRANGNLTIVTVKNVTEGLRAVSFNQIDAYIENLAVAAYYIDKEGIPNLRVVGSTDYSFAWSIGVSREYPILYKAIQKTLSTIPQSELETIRKRWISLQVQSEMSPETIQNLTLISVFTLILIVSLAGISYFLKRKLNEKITHLKKSQQEFLDQAEILQLAMDATQAGVWDSRVREKKIYLSRQWCEMLGYAPKEKAISLKELRGFIHPDDITGVDRTIADYISKGGQDRFEVEFRLLRADSTWCWVLSKAKAVSWDEKGTPLRIIGLDINIQKFKEVQGLLAQSEAKFRAVFDHAPYAISINDLDGRYLDANPALLRSRNLSKEEILKHKALDFAQISKDEEASILENLQKDGAVSDLETTVKKKDGTYAHALYSSALVEIQGEKQILSMVVDITKLKQAEEALKESEERFRSLFQMAPLPLVELATDGHVLAFNNRVQEVLGYTLDDIPTIEQWWENAYPEPAYRNRAMSTWQEAVEKAKNRHTDIQSGEFRVACKDGTVRNMIIEASIIGSSLLVSLFDITERKYAEAEQEKLQDQLLQAQKLEAVGVLAGGVAHDFNNMLGAIIGYAELTIENMDVADPLRTNLIKILDVAQRSAALTRQLLTFARKQTVTPIPFDMNKSIESMLKILRRLIGENIELIWLPAESNCTIKMDPSQLDQILANLCVNAKDAIVNVGKITIKTERVVFDDVSCKAYADCNPGNYIQLTVSDDGCGMDKNILEHVFEPFFTTKDLGKGTGLGLATLYGIVKQNGGFINLYSEPDIGTTFKIFIPAHLEATTAKKSETIDDIPLSQGETVLIVEDDPTLIEMGQMMLQRLGYEVLSATSPTDAIAIVEEKRDDIHLFITDVVMPEMNGRELVDRILKIKPDMKYMYMSGYTADIIAHQGVLGESANFIQKPFFLKDIATKIRSVLRCS